MEENTTTTNSTNSGGMKKMVVPIAVVVIIVIAAIAFFAARSKKDSAPTNSAPQVTQAPQETSAPASSYKNGTYSVVGNYVSPGGPREVNVTITLTDGIITDSQFEGLATDPTSIRFQGEFGNNYKPMVVGKNIDEVALTKVSGSSLTPKGFQDALQKVKAQAKS